MSGWGEYQGGVEGLAVAVGIGVSISLNGALSNLTNILYKVKGSTFSKGFGERGAHCICRELK